MERFRDQDDSYSVQCYQEASKEYAKLLQQEESFWKQRAKQYWLQGGDCNSKFFHAYASNRKKKNQITQLKDDCGQWRNWENGLGNLIESFYGNLFTSNTVEMTEVIDSIEEKISPAQNQMLTEEFTREEVKEAIFAMHPDKSPGPDGMNPAFFQHFWSIIGNDVTQACLNILSSQIIPSRLNDTIVVLIPKKKHPETMNDLRPISLCNVMMKIITKMLANRLKILLPEVISETQSAFIPGRLITDNVIASFEINHWMHRKTQGKVGCSALKIDMSKAYDRVEWNFVMGVMRKMGFTNTWLNWMHMCMSTVRYNFLTSGHEVGPIIPERGLRQGDPISPHLFLLCTEGLSALIQKYQVRGRIHGCKIANGAPVVTHLFFADDSYLFFRATVNEAQCIKDCLRIYERASGQQVNFQKSSIQFSRNTSSDVAAQISQNLQVPVRNDDLYLGLPKMVARNKWEVFKYIKEKVWGVFRVGKARCSHGLAKRYF